MTDRDGAMPMQTCPFAPPARRTAAEDPSARADLTPSVSMREAVATRQQRLGGDRHHRRTSGWSGCHPIQDARAYDAPDDDPRSDARPFTAKEKLAGAEAKGLPRLAVSIAAERLLFDTAPGMQMFQGASDLASSHVRRHVRGPTGRKLIFRPPSPAARQLWAIVVARGADLFGSRRERSRRTARSTANANRLFRG